MFNRGILFVIACVLTRFTSAVWICSENDDCSAVEGSVCSNGECVCPPATQSVLTGTKCAAHAPYHSSPCFEDFQCSRLFTNFECRRNNESEAGQCFCRNGFHYFHGRCWQSIDWGQQCTRDEECMNTLRDPFSMSCNEGVCACAEDYYLRQRGECRKSALAVGDACVIDEDCQFEGGTCQISTFTCIDGTSAIDEIDSINEISSAESKSILSTVVSNLTREHGVLCGVSSPCESPFLCSSSGVCVCPLGYYPNGDGTICLAEMGSPVTSPGQCDGFFTEIRNDICTCQVNFYFDETMRGCVKPTVRPGDSCVIDENCHTFGALSRCGPPGQWELRTCECTPGQTVWNENRLICALFGGIGELCEVDSDCIAGDLEIQCVQNDEGYGVCSCPEGYQAVGDLCLLLGQELNEPCQVDQECETIEHAVCDGNRTCVCGEGYQQIEDHCAPIIGGTCVENNDCIIENTICEPNTNTCQCNDGFVTFSESCWPVVSEFGGACNVTLQCSASLGVAGSCDNGLCVCGQEFHFRDGVCWPRTGLFETCSRSSQCFLEDASHMLECRNSLCQCSFYYPYSHELGTCTAAGGAVNIIGSYKLLLISVLYLYFS